MTGDLIRWYEEEALELEGIPDAPGGFKPIGCLMQPFMADLTARMDAWKRFWNICESPIEIALGIELAVRGKHVFDEYSIEMIPQFRFQRFRMDWDFLQSGKPLVFVECDGRDFHSTPEQLQNDRRKDEAAADAGIQLVRFSGSEIYRYPDGCVNRVLDYVVRCV